MINFVSAQLLETTSYKPNLNDGLIQIQEHSQSEDETECKKLDFCWYENRCYPLGYRLGEKYCSDRDPYYLGKYGIEVSNFVNQSEIGKTCINNYECKTNICSDNVCINLTEQTNISSLNETIKISSGISNPADFYTTNPIPETNYEKKSIIQKIADFFKNLFR